MINAIVITSIILLLAACTTDRDTQTPRSVNEQLLLSSATDRAAQKLVLPIPADRKVFLDTSEFDGVDAKYAIGSIRDSLLRQGIAIADSKDAADVVVSLRAGVLATGNSEFLIGTPSYSLPIPLSGIVTIPKIPLYDSEAVDGVAKFAATGTDRKTGRLIVSIEPQYGVASRTDHTLLFFISWTDKDYTDPQP